jgi:hypothetical protein
MSREVNKNLYVGTDADCINRKGNDWAVIHACKTCHKRRIGYSGNLSQNHPEYLVRIEPNDLYLNIVDMEEPLRPIYTNPIMAAAMKFTRDNIFMRNVLIHCNKGNSRAPSIALLYLASASIIPKDDYSIAKKEFRKIYPLFLPARGIESYMRINWSTILDL